MRLAIEKIARTDWPAKVGVVDLSPCWSAPSRFGILDARGNPVAFRTLWSAPGEATRVCFDTSSGETTYSVCFGADLPSAGGTWEPEAGVFLETRPCRSDLPIDTEAQVERLLNNAGAPTGGDFVSNIFLGANPFGPSTYYIATFNGWFTVPSADRYTFATASDDASFLEVDHQAVAKWLGKHGAEGGARGEHSGTIPLSAGRHQLTYVQIQFDNASAAVAAWKPPKRQHVEVMPASAFLPVARFHATRFKGMSDNAERLYFDWHSVDHCALGGAIFIQVEFRVVDNSPGRKYRWYFDDGSEAEGVNPRHFFPKPGLRQVKLEASKDGVVVATNSLRVRISPEWQQRQWWREDVFYEAKDDFLRRNLTLMPPHDLVAVWDLAERADDQELMTGAGRALIKRQEEFSGSTDAGTYYKIGLVFEHQGDAGGVLAEKAFRLALSPERAMPAISDQAKLHLAALLLHCSGQIDEAGKVLGTMTGGLLNADERKLWRLLQGDLLLARGQPEQARRQYASIGGKQPDGQWSITRAARLESAAILLEHGHWDDAQAALDQLQLESPLERISLDTRLLVLHLELGRKEFQRALMDGQTLLKVAGDDPRQSEILFTVVETGLALGKEQEAQRALDHLLKDFPYSEAAAKAKDRWTKR
jgi:hypothetical protein